jgi:hypothetical protein
MEGTEAVFVAIFEEGIEGIIDDGIEAVFEPGSSDSSR